MFKTMASAAAAMVLCVLSGCTTATTAANPPAAAHTYSACAPHPSTYDCQVERYLNVD